MRKGCLSQDDRPAGGRAEVVETSGLSSLNQYRMPARGARIARREERACWAQVSDEQRREPGCPARQAVVIQRGRATRSVNLDRAHYDGLRTLARRRSRVSGVSVLSIDTGVSGDPGVWPMAKNRARRRASASFEFTGKVA